MKKRRVFSMLAIVTLLLPLIGAFVSFAHVTQVSAAAFGGRVMQSYQTQTNNLYTGTVTEYTFSLNGIVQQSPTPPTHADWVTPSDFRDGGWFTNSSNEVFTYSNFGEIHQTNDPVSIPSTATWATISAFLVAASGVPSIPPPAIHDTKFQYSMNGVDILEETNVLSIPTDALWVALVNFNDGWTQTINHTFSNYTIDRTAPVVQSLSISSNSGHATYAKKGDEVTVALQTDIPVASPVIKIADTALTASGAGTSWSASLELTDAVNEGVLSVSTAVYSDKGGPSTVLSITTDGSSVIYDKSGPSLSHTLTPTHATNQSVIVQVNASDVVSGVELLKMDAGNHTESYFETGGIPFTNSFTAITNGNYTVYARDVAGNVTLLPITVSNIDHVAPSVSLTASTTALTNTDIVVQAIATDNVAIGKQLWTEGLQNQTYFQAGEGISFSNEFTAARNGVYTVYVEDTAGNYALATITITNLIKQAPEVTLTTSPNTPTNDTVLVSVSVTAEGDAQGNTLAALRWAEGEKQTAFFTSGGGTDILNELEFKGLENGEYSVYARDAAGNETVATITISNIDHTSPSLTLTPNTSASTNVPVIITVSAADDESGLKEVRWSEEAPVPNLPWSSSEVLNGEFQVTANGTYTVMAVDHAGNETMQQISVSNIHTQAPTLLLKPDTTQPTGDNVYVTVEATALGNGNAIDVVRWAYGDQPISFFHGGPSKDITDTLGFDITTNGAYTVYARDLAGNEAVETIDVSIIRSTNANLATLVVQNTDQTLPLLPSFTPGQLQYKLQVGSTVSSVLLKAGAEETSAVVSVNGKPLAAGDSIPVLLSPGVNTIRIVVTAPLTSVQQTYTIELTRERPVSPGGEVPPGNMSSGNESSEDVPSGSISSGKPATNIFAAKLNGKELPGLNETIKSDSSGQLLYELKLDDASSIVALSQSSGANELRIEPNSQTTQSIDAVMFRISVKALSQLKDRNIKVALNIGDAVYEIPAEVQVVRDGELVVNLQALRQVSEAEQLRHSVVNMLDGMKWQPKLVGAPIVFSTNATGLVDKGTLVIPLPTGLDQTALRKLALFLESESKSKSIASPTIRYDAKGQAIAFVIDIHSSGRAVMLQAEPVTIIYERYINGYADGSFAPKRAITRAELVTLLMKLSALVDTASTSSPEKMFADVPLSYWGAEAVRIAAEHDWVNGYKDNLFHPDDPLTRAELASVLVRWRELQPSGPTSFSDVNSHWASAAIATAEQADWMEGYEDGSFRPSRSVSRAEVVTILNRVLNRPSHSGEDRIWSDVPFSHWAVGSINSASQAFEANYYLSGEVEAK